MLLGRISQRDWIGQGGDLLAPDCRRRSAKRVALQGSFSQSLGRGAEGTGDLVNTLCLLQAICLVRSRQQQGIGTRSAVGQQILEPKGQIRTIFNRATAASSPWL